MRILKATSKNILIASKIVRRGGLVVFPTDTVYGLGCDPLNAKAVKRLLRTKSGRRKPLPVLASDLKHVGKVAYMPERARKIAAMFWPGPLTLVVPKKPLLSGLITCNLNSVGVRIPGHNEALQLIHLSNGLLVGTSANKTGEKPSQTAPEAAEQLGKDVDIILDGGPAAIGTSSTVVDMTSEKPRILRKGPIRLREILPI